MAMLKLSNIVYTIYLLPESKIFFSNLDHSNMAAKSGKCNISLCYIIHVFEFFSFFIVS